MRSSIVGVGQPSQRRLLVKDELPLVLIVRIGAADQRDVWLAPFAACADAIEQDAHLFGDREHPRRLDAEGCPGLGGQGIEDRRFALDDEAAREQHNCIVAEHAAIKLHARLSL